jgi:hypothetical protein
MRNTLKRVIRAIFAEEFLKAAEQAQSWRELVAECRRHAFGAR